MSCPNCPMCKKKGFPILLTRYALALNDAKAPDATNDMANIPEVNGAKPSDLTHYTRRLLRAGWVYVFDEKRNQWFGYKVTDQAYLVEFPISRSGPDNNIDPPETVPCEPQITGAIAGAITIPDAEKASKLWIAFSDCRWTQAVWEKHNNDQQFREEHMQCFDVSKWFKQKKHDHTKSIEELATAVAEYAQDAHNGCLAFSFTPSPFLYRRHNLKRAVAKQGLSLSEDTEAKVFGTDVEYREVWINGMVKEFSELMEPLNPVSLRCFRFGEDPDFGGLWKRASPFTLFVQALKENTQANVDEMKATFGDNGAIFSLNDPSGIASDLAALAHLRFEKFHAGFMKENDNLRKSSVSAAIVQLQEQVEGAAQANLVNTEAQDKYREKRGGLREEFAIDAEGHFVHKPENYLDPWDDNDEIMEQFFGIPTQEQIELYRKNAWNKYQAKYSESDRVNFENEAAAKKEQWEQGEHGTLLNAYKKWLTGQSLFSYLEGNFDTEDAESGSVYSAVMIKVIADVQNYKITNKVLCDWMSADDFSDKKNLLMRMFVFNQDELAEVVHSASDAMDKVAQIEVSNFTTDDVRPEFKKRLEDIIAKAEAKTADSQVYVDLIKELPTALGSDVTSGELLAVVREQREYFAAIGFTCAWMSKGVFKDFMDKRVIRYTDRANRLAAASVATVKAQEAKVNEQVKKVRAAQANLDKVKQFDRLRGDLRIQREIMLKQVMGPMMATFPKKETQKELKRIIALVSMYNETPLLRVVHNMPVKNALMAVRKYVMGGRKQPGAVSRKLWAYLNQIARNPKLGQDLSSRARKHLKPAEIKRFQSFLNCADIPDEIKKELRWFGVSVLETDLNARTRTSGIVMVDLEELDVKNLRGIGPNSPTAIAVTVESNGTITAKEVQETKARIRRLDELLGSLAEQLDLEEADFFRGRVASLAELNKRIQLIDQESEKIKQRLAEVHEERRLADKEAEEKKQKFSTRQGDLYHEQTQLAQAQAELAQERQKLQSAMGTAAHQADLAQVNLGRAATARKLGFMVEGGIFNTVGMIAQYFAIKVAYESLENAAGIKENKIAKARINATIAGAVGAGLEMAGWVCDIALVQKLGVAVSQKMPQVLRTAANAVWDAGPKRIFSKLGNPALKSTADLLRRIGSRVGGAAIMALGTLDLITGYDEFIVGRASMGALYVASGLIGIFLGGYIFWAGTLAAGLPVLICSVLLFGIYVVIGIFQDNPFQKWLGRSIFGVYDDKYASAAEEMQTLRTLSGEPEKTSLPVEPISKTAEKSEQSEKASQVKPFAPALWFEPNLDPNFVGSN